MFGTEKNEPLLFVYAVAALSFFTSSHSAIAHEVYKPYSDYSDPIEEHSNLCGENAGKVARQAKAENQEATIFNLLAHGWIKESIEDGFVVGFEKFQRNETNTKHDHHKAYLKEFERKDWIWFGNQKIRNRLLKEAFSDPKPVIVTHIYEYENSKVGQLNLCPVYTAYEVQKNQTCKDRHSTVVRSEKTFDNGIEALRQGLKGRLEMRLKEGSFTHIIFMAMGWHNDQKVSICRFRTLIENTKEAMSAEGQQFK